MRAGIPFTVWPSTVPELPPDTALLPEQLTVENARRKAVEVSARFAGRIVLGADTLVALDGTVLGKPASREDAVRTLRFLSGRTHAVMTGICLTDGTRTVTDVSVTHVTFYPLSESQIEQYVSTGECDDKAGAYGIQERGSVLVERIQGDYFGVVGLPVGKVVRLLERF